jgi:hypothetical protein
VEHEFGVPPTEADAFLHATRRHELHPVPGRHDQSGWTLPAEQAAILTDYGIPAHATADQPVEPLALAVQVGHGVIAMVNAGVLWSDLMTTAFEYEGGICGVTDCAHAPGLAKPTG